jgi:hypothetical protein
VQLAVYAVTDAAVSVVLLFDLIRQENVVAKKAQIAALEASFQLSATE